MSSKKKLYQASVVFRSIVVRVTASNSREAWRKIRGKLSKRKQSAIVDAQDSNLERGP